MRGKTSDIVIGGASIGLAVMLFAVGAVFGGMFFIVVASAILLTPSTR